MPLLRPQFLLLTVTIALTACVPGCGVKPPDGLVPVTGVLQWNSGEPCEGIDGIMRFHPFDPSQPNLETSAESTKQEVSATIGSDGTFEVETSRLVNRKAHRFSGAAPGQYKIMLFLLPGEQGTPRINPDYQHPVRTPLLAEIKPGQPNHLELIVERHLNGWTP